MPTVKIGRIAQQLLIIQANALNQQIPLVLMQKVSVFIRVQARMPHPFQKCILFKPRPQHREVIQFKNLPHVKTPDTLLKRNTLEIVHDLTLASGRACQQRQNIENW